MENALPTKPSRGGELTATNPLRGTVYFRVPSMKMPKMLGCTFVWPSRHLYGVSVYSCYDADGYLPVLEFITYGVLPDA